MCSSKLVDIINHAFTDTGDHTRALSEHTQPSSSVNVYLPTVNHWVNMTQNKLLNRSACKSVKLILKLKNIKFDLICNTLIVTRDK